MYSYADIRAIHLEITSKCNARCPMCLRTVCGGEDNPNLPLVELSIDHIKKIFEPRFIKQLDRLYMCGNYGDPLFAQDTLEAYKYFRESNPNIRLDMFTNGSARPEPWWKELAQTIDLVHFSVDGLEDTNHIYRKGTNFQNILRSMKAYLGAGGVAVWDFIVFKHNEHQVDEARQLSEELGFKSFNVKKTGRFFSNSRMTGKNKQEVFKVDGQLDYFIEMPENKKYHNQALTKEQALVEKYGSLEKYLDFTPVQCKVEKEKSLYISAMGQAFPCCWTANQLYPWYYPKQKSYMWDLLDELENGVDDINVLKRGLETVVNGAFFQKVLPQSWELKSIKEGKPKCCAKTCGSEFDPFRAQFGQTS
jgi:MoaA/NifB/PqqE/SkfB family radical SAM enzyme